VTAFGEDVDPNTFDVERLRDCSELRISARNRAISLSDNPAGMGSTGRECGSMGGGKEFRGWRATISVAGSSTTNGRGSLEISESWVASKEFRSKGVTFASAPVSTKSVDKGKIDLGLARLRRHSTKATIPISAKMAPEPPIVPPTIAPMFRFLCNDGFVGVLPLAFIVSTGALRGS
jgi:hypothetical protein